MRALPLQLMLALGLFLFAGSSFAQETPSKEVIEKLKQAYSNIKKPEIPFEKFLEINAHVYKNQTGESSKTGTTSAVLALPQDTYCSKVRSYCANSDFETGLDQDKYTGAYGFWYGSLYPDPFALTYGFSSGVISSGSAHQTVVDKSAGLDAIAGISVVPINGGNKSLRLGNSVNGNGTELIAKTVTVDPNESILGFYYAVVLQDPGHTRTEQPAFIVRAYDCATGLELPNVCDLGNGSNIAVADANNPFFQNKIYQSERLVYRDWSRVQIDLSKYVGKNVIIVFNVKDCDQGGHFGYAYIDNLFSNQCNVDPLSDYYIKKDSVHTSTCGMGNICVKYKLPTPLSSPTTNGSAVISLDIYQNNTLVKTLNSPTISGYTPDSTYCFSINPATLGINTSIGSFDYTTTGRFTLSGFLLSSVIIGNPGTGIISGINNDYMVTCPSVYYSKPSGDLHNTLTWGLYIDGSGANPPDFGAGKTFMLANRMANYTMTADWSVGGILNVPSGGQLQINGSTLAVADLTGAGSLSGTTTSNLIVNQPITSGGTALNFTAGSNSLNNLGIASAATTTVSSALNIYGVLTAQSGTLNTGNLLTLKSTAMNTARVAPVTGSITGSVIVERYIPARRAWRIMSAPVSGTQTVNAAWQEGATTSSMNANPNPGYGTHITEGSAASGFDHNPLIAMTSIKKYVSASDTWMPLANTNATSVNSDAYLLFVRGERGLSLGLNTVPATSTTLRASGPLKSGDQTFPVSASGFTAIPNPFASPINFATLTRTNVQNNFYLWDPKMGGEDGVGAYVLLSYNGISYDVIPAAVSPESQYIQSGQGFLVHSTGAAGSLVIKESDKSATAATDVFRVSGSTATGNRTPFNVPVSSNTTGLRINLQSINADNTTSVLDEVLSAYGSNFSDKVDQLDAQKIPNVEENLAIIRDNQKLMADRSAALEEKDIIQLQLWNTSAAKKYLLEFNPANLSGAVSTAYLEDHYLKTSTPVSLNKVSQLFFTVNADAASSAANRFTITFTAASDAPAVNNRNGIITYPNPVSGKTIQLLFNNQPQGTYNAELVNSLGQIVYKTQINHGGGSVIQKLQLSNKPAPGVYMMNITNQSARNTIKIVIN